MNSPILYLIHMFYLDLKGKSPENGCGFVELDAFPPPGGIRVKLRNAGCHERENTTPLASPDI
ncbi:MAG: hypothetical protein WD708_10740, partial [Kiritimatiellia bacterium]